MTVAWRSANVGDIVAYLKNANTDSSEAGTHYLIVIADAAAGMFHKEWPQGKLFDKAIYYTEAIPDNVFTEMTFK